MIWIDFFPARLPAHGLRAGSGGLAAHPSRWKGGLRSGDAACQTDIQATLQASEGQAAGQAVCILTVLPFPVRLPLPLR